MSKGQAASLGFVLAQMYQDGRIGVAALCIGLLSVAKSALEAGDADGAVMALARLPEGFQGVLAPLCVAEEPRATVLAVAAALLASGVVVDGVDVALLGPLDVDGPVS